MKPLDRFIKVRRAVRALSAAKKRLSATQLAKFATPLTWTEICALEPWMPRTWWRYAVLDADEHGRGLLRWLPHRKAWALTDRGRSVVGLPIDSNDMK